MQVDSIFRVAGGVLVGFFLTVVLIHVVGIFVGNGEEKAERIVVDQTAIPVTDRRQKSTTDQPPMSDHAHVRCHIYMDTKGEFLGELKDCRDFTGYTINGACEPQQSGKKFGATNQGKDHIECCKMAFLCNAERYCGEGNMECDEKNGSVNPVCVCPKGIMGHRCEKCSHKIQVCCDCNKAYEEFNEDWCESVYYTNTSVCRTKHTVGGAEVPCRCKADPCDALPDSRCKGDPTEPCGK